MKGLLGKLIKSSENYFRDESLQKAACLLQHPLGAAPPKIPFGSIDPQPKPERQENALRLLRAFTLSINEADYTPRLANGGNGDMWQGISDAIMNDLRDAIEAERADLLADALMNFGRSFTWFGGVSTSIDGYNRNQTNEHIALTYWDNLLRLAEFVGVIPVENPEAGPWGDALNKDPEAIISAIEKKLGISVAPPMGIIHTDGILLRGYALHYRHINAIYSAVRLKQLSGLRRSRRFVEIGGGIGLAAYYARQFSLTDYTLLDLPITNLLSANFLMMALNPRAVCLHGEETEGSKVKILPFWGASRFRDNSFDICLNQDSINEMPENIRDWYRDEIGRVVEGYFVSINHEYFFPKTVNALFGSSFGFRLVHRSPYWIRSGYVEELFEVGLE